MSVAKHWLASPKGALVCMAPTLLQRHRTDSSNSCNNREDMKFGNLSAMKRRDTAAMSLPMENLEAVPTIATAVAGGIIIAIVAKLWAYSQLEIIRASMLSRHVKQSSARVLQIGGTTRDLFYYPKSSIQVTVMSLSKDAKRLWENAGVQAGVPVVYDDLQVEQPMTTICSESLDSIILFDNLMKFKSWHAALEEFWRILKPGGTFVFIQKQPGPFLLTRTSDQDGEACVGDMIAQARPWDFVQWDLALDVLDPHVVGVAVKPLRQENGVQSSVDIETLLQLRKKGKNRRR